MQGLICNLSSLFPFYNISDDDFCAMFGAPIETRLLNFKTAYFDPFDHFDRYLGGVDLDEIISRTVKCNRQVCEYHSVEDTVYLVC